MTYVGDGIQRVADCLTGYLRHENRDDDLLMDYAGRFGNGAVYKRLGFLVENDPGAEPVPQSCKARLTNGNARLDPPDRLLAPRVEMGVSGCRRTGLEVPPMIDKREIVDTATALGLNPLRGGEGVSAPTLKCMVGAAELRTATSVPRWQRMRMSRYPSMVPAPGWRLHRGTSRQRQDT